MVHAEMIKCQNCSFPLEIRILGIFSGLGPRNVLCRKCGQVLETNRSDWPLESGKQQSYLLLIFVVYLILGFMIGAELFSSAEARWHSRSYQRFEFADSHYREMGWLGLSLVLAMLIQKIWNSMGQKQRGIEREVSRAHILQPNFIFGGHLKALIIFIAPEAFIFLYRWLEHIRS